MASSAFLPTTKTALTTVKDIICGKVLSGSTSTAVTASGATAIDASLNNVFAVNVTATTTVSISNHLPGQVITFIVACGGSEPVRDVDYRAIHAPFRTITPKGVSIRAEQGVIVTDSDLNAIDAGMDKLFAESRCAGYTRALEHRQYQVAMLAADTSDPSRDPEFRVPCAQYCGGQYDKGGYITIAGKMISAGGDNGQLIALAEHRGTKPDHLALSAQYEGEHIVLAWNDGDRYEATKTHGIGTGHPIIAECRTLKR